MHIDMSCEITDLTLCVILKGLSLVTAIARYRFRLKSGTANQWLAETGQQVQLFLPTIAFSV